MQFSRVIIVAAIVAVALVAVPSNGIIVDENINWEDPTLPSILSAYFGADLVAAINTLGQNQYLAGCRFGEYQAIGGGCQRICPVGSAIADANFVGSIRGAVAQPQDITSFVTVHCRPCNVIMATSDFIVDHLEHPDGQSIVGGFCGCLACESTRSYNDANTFQGCAPCSSDSQGSSPSPYVLDAMTGNGRNVNVDADVTDTCEAEVCVDAGPTPGPGEGECVTWVADSGSSECRTTAGVYSETSKCVCLEINEEGSSDCFNEPMENWPANHQ
jgi:hypothetical protein